MGIIVRVVGRYNVVTHVDSCFIQMFFWERFSVIAPKPDGVSGCCDGGGGIPIRLQRDETIYKPRVWRWFNGKQPSNKSLVNVIDKEETSHFKKPYSYTLGGIMKPLLFGKMNEEVSLIPREGSPLP